MALLILWHCYGKMCVMKVEMIVQAAESSTPTSATATQASRLFPKPATAAQPTQRPAASGN